MKIPFVELRTPPPNQNILYHQVYKTPNTQMPKSPKRRTLLVGRETKRLVHEAISITGSRRGATFKDIKRYVNIHTTSPYVHDAVIKKSLRHALYSGNVSNNGGHFKINSLLPAYFPKKKDVRSTIAAKVENRPSSQRITSLHGWKKMIFVLLGLFILFSLFTAVKAETDDDDDILGEILIDLMTGIAIDMCSQNAVCSQVMFMMTALMLVLAVLISCCTGECICECDRKTARRAGTTYAGVQMSRWLRS